MRRIVLGFALGVVLAVCAVRVLGASDSTEGLKPGDVITGQDVGFRVQKVGTHIVGTFVVRVDGKWRAAEASKSFPQVVPATP